MIVWCAWEGRGHRLQTGTKAGYTGEQSKPPLLQFPAHVTVYPFNSCAFGYQDPRSRRLVRQRWPSSASSHIPDVRVNQDDAWAFFA